MFAISSSSSCCNGCVNVSVPYRKNSMVWQAKCMLPTSPISSTHKSKNKTKANQSIHIPFVCKKLDTTNNAEWNEEIQLIECKKNALQCKIELKIYWPLSSPPRICIAAMYIHIFFSPSVCWAPLAGFSFVLFYSLGLMKKPNSNITCLMHSHTSHWINSTFSNSKYQYDGAGCNKTLTTTVANCALVFSASSSFHSHCNNRQWL